MLSRLFTFLALALAAGAGCASAQSAPKPPSPQLLAAKLITILDSGEVKAGKKFHAYVMGDWTNGQCTLHPGAEIDGHVSQVDRRTKTEKNADLHLVLDSAECEKHHKTPLQMSLLALVGPDVPAPGGESGVGKDPELTNQPLSIAGGLRSVETAANNNAYALTGRSVPTTWTPGMVVYLPGTSLHVGSGAQGGSIVTTTNNDVRLLPNTVLIVMVVR